MYKAEQSGKEIKKTIPFIIVLKIGVYWTKFKESTYMATGFKTTFLLRYKWVQQQDSCTNNAPYATSVSLIQHANVHHFPSFLFHGLKCELRTGAPTLIQQTNVQNQRKLAWVTKSKETEVPDIPIAQSVLFHTDGLPNCLLWDRLEWKIEICLLAWANIMLSAFTTAA
jgi:hypothetical protein